MTYRQGPCGPVRMDGLGQAIAVARLPAKQPLMQPPPRGSCPEGYWWYAAAYPIPPAMLPRCGQGQVPYSYPAPTWWARPTTPGLCVGCVQLPPPPLPPPPIPIPQVSALPVSVNVATVAMAGPCAPPAADRTCR